MLAKPPTMTVHRSRPPSLPPSAIATCSRGSNADRRESLAFSYLNHYMPHFEMSKTACQTAGCACLQPTSTHPPHNHHMRCACLRPTSVTTCHLGSNGDSCVRLPSTTLVTAMRPLACRPSKAWFNAIRCGPERVQHKLETLVASIFVLLVSVFICWHACLTPG